MKYICITADHAWGSSFTNATEAKKKAKKEGGSLKRYVVYACEDDDACVTGMGAIEYKQGAKNTLIESKGQGVKRSAA